VKVKLAVRLPGGEAIGSDHGGEIGGMLSGEFFHRKTSIMKSGAGFSCSRFHL
jgi:hypothetical protein